MKINVNTDTSSVDALSGYMSGFAEVVSSRKYISAVLDYTYNSLAFEYGFAMDSTARLHPEIYNHVYEWGDRWGDYSTVGSIDDRLWQLVPVGRGNTRTVGFTFLPSTKPSPINPALLEEGPTGQSVKEGVHVFTWKAPVMEYGLTVTIRPELGEVLVFLDDANDELVFTKRTIHAVPGKNGNIGAFTGFFVKWWGTSAHNIFTNRIKPQLERDIANRSGITELLARYKRRKQVNIRTTGDFNSGKSAAKRQFGKKQAQYIAQAAERRYDLYGY